MIDRQGTGAGQWEAGTGLGESSKSSKFSKMEGCSMIMDLLIHPRSDK